MVLIHYFNFAGKLAFVHGVISILSATPTDCFKKKSMLVNLFFRGKKFFQRFFDFHFRENPRFREEFQALFVGLLKLSLFTLTFRVTYRPLQNMPVPPDPPCSAPRWMHSFSARFRSVWREFGNKTFLNYYGTLSVSFVYTSLLSAPRGTWSEIWFF